MGVDAFEISVNLLKMIFIFLMMVQLVPMLVWVERRGSAFIQNRFGPNRVGPLGLTQLLADAVKFLFKEEFIPGDSKKFLFYAAPVVSLIPAALAFGAIPLSIPIYIEEFEMLGSQYGPYRFAFQSFEIGIGIVFVLGVSSLAAYSVLLAGWASSNKYAMFGALRACAQTISYELGLGLSLVGILLLYNTFDFTEMIAAQEGVMSFMFLGQSMEIPFLPNWGIFYQPVGAFLFLVSVFAETNRSPFDLPEAEAELVAGFHTEYSGFKMNLFFIGEYGHMLVASALFATLYLGGYHLPFITPNEVSQWVGQYTGFGVNLVSILTAFVIHFFLLGKILLLLWLFIWVRWTVPRFRYDQLMSLGWKTILPWALANTIITALLIYIMRASGS